MIGYCYCEIKVNYLKYKVENAKHLGLSNFIWLLIAVPIRPITITSINDIISHSYFLCCICY